MTTAAARLVALSGLSGVSAGAHLLAIKLAGTTAGAMLVSRSSLGSATAWAHLLDGGAISPEPEEGTPPVSGGMAAYRHRHTGNSTPSWLPFRPTEEDEALLLIGLL